MSFTSVEHDAPIFWGRSGPSADSRLSGDIRSFLTFNGYDGQSSKAHVTSVEHDAPISSGGSIGTSAESSPFGERGSGLTFVG